MARIYNDLTKLIGRTPLVRLNRLAADLPGDVLVKLEAFNPYSSVKDRIGLSMIEAAERDGELRPGMTIVEATSGNTGISLAFIAAIKGYKIVLVMPDTMTVERRNMLKALGARLELTPGEEGMKAAMARADAIAADIPEVWQPCQFDNPSNVEMHRETTGPEIWADTDGEVDVLVAGVGTGGTISGTSSFLKSKNPNVHVVAVEPTDSPVLSGGEPGLHKIQGIGAGFVPAVYDESAVDEVLCVTNEASLEASRKLCRTEGVLSGVSTGASIAAALEVAARPESAGKTIVCIAPDFGERYLSHPLYSELEAS